VKGIPRLALGFLAAFGFLGGNSHAQNPGGKDSCLECHSRLSGALKRAVSDWRGSTHFEQKIGCVDCHGGDKESDRYPKSPGTGYVGIPRMHDVPYFCGKCHGEIKEKHLGSPHGSHGLPNCISCHGHHGISKPEPEKIITEKNCTKCHDFKAPQKALKALEKANTLQKRMESKLEDLEHLPVAKAAFLAKRKELHLDQAGVIATFHSFQIGKIQEIGTNADQLLKTFTKLEERENLRRVQKAREVPFILSLMGFLVLGTFFGFLVFHKGPPIGTT